MSAISKAAHVYPLSAEAVTTITSTLMVQEYTGRYVQIPADNHLIKMNEVYRHLLNSVSDDDL